MRRRTRRVGWRTWVLGAVGAAVAGTVLARRSERMAELRAKARARLRGVMAALPAAAASVAARLPAPSAAPEPAAPAPPAVPAESAAAAGGAELWVASRIGTTYYRAGCRSAERLAAAQRVTFQSEAEAQAAGYKRSSAAGC